MCSSDLLGEATSGAPAHNHAGKKPRKMAGKTGRARAREFIVQALYQHLVGGNDAAAIDQFTRELTGFHKGDGAHFDAVFHGCVQNAAALDALIVPKLDRGLQEISPIEHACMWIGVYELQHCPSCPKVYFFYQNSLKNLKFKYFYHFYYHTSRKQSCS